MLFRLVVLISVLALGSALVFVSLTPELPWQSANERWGSAVMNERFEAAEALMSGSVSRRWAVKAERLREEHGELRGYQSTVVGLPPPGSRAVYRQRLIWEDGFVSCILTRERPDGALGLLSS